MVSREQPVYIEKEVIKYEDRVVYQDVSSALLETRARLRDACLPLLKLQGLREYRLVGGNSGQTHTSHQHPGAL